MIRPDREHILGSYSPVALSELEGLKLMNRMDTKYLFCSSMIPRLLESLKDDYRILEINGSREFQYRTSYFDTKDLFFFHQHLRGKLARFKVRFRRYETTGDSFLEVKKKTNKNKTNKWRISRNSEAIDEVASEFISKHIHLNASTLLRGIENDFVRITLAGFNSRERITFDHSISYTSPSGNYEELPFMAIGELKSEGFPPQSPFVKRMKDAGIRPVGFSKYCYGTAILNSVQKANLLKPKMLLINKIRNEYTQLTGS